MYFQWKIFWLNMAQQQTNGSGAVDLSLDDSKKQGTR
jgi:hypothetical protein